MNYYFFIIRLFLIFCAIFFSDFEQIVLFCKIKYEMWLS